jgi:SdrD B-like protein
MRARIVVLALMMSPLLVGQAQSRAKTKEPARAESRGKDSRGKVEQQGGERGNNDSSCEKAQNQQGQHEGQHEDGKCAPATKPPVPPVPPVPVVGVAQIHGTVFNDVTADGKFDYFEVGLAGWTITLSGPVTASAVTAWDGTYAFTALPVGTYTVCSVAQAGWTATAPATPCWSLDVPATMPDLWYGAIDFGVKQ